MPTPDGHDHDVHEDEHAAPDDHGGRARGHAHAHAGQVHGSGAHGVGRAAQRRALWFALAANGAFLVVEVAAALAFGSLALLADAGHMLSDVAALAIALVAARLAERPASARQSYGWERAEVLGALVNAVALVAVCGWVVVTALPRLGEPVDVPGGGLMGVAAVGLLINIVSAVRLERAGGSNLNMRGAYIHMVLDAAGSFGALVAGAAILLWDASWADPAASLAISALVLWSTWGLLRDTSLVLLEGAPRGLHPSDVEALLLADAEVEAVHHLHLWSLASDSVALSAHVVLQGELTLHEAQEQGERLKLLLERELAITHATLELECHPCDPVDDHVARAPEASRHGTTPG